MSVEVNSLVAGKPEIIFFCRRDREKSRSVRKTGTGRPAVPPWCTLLLFKYGNDKKAASSTRSVRQSVTIPATLATEVQRLANERHVTISRALVALAERGVRAEAEAKAQLKASYRRFIDEKDPAVKNEVGLDLRRCFRIARHPGLMRRSKRQRVRIGLPVRPRPL